MYRKVIQEGGGGGVTYIEGNASYTVVKLMFTESDVPCGMHQIIEGSL